MSSLLKIVSKSFRFLTVLMILTILILIGQKIIEAIIHPLFPLEHTPYIDQPEKILSDTEKKQQRIAHADKQFSPEGTLYLLSRREPNQGTSLYMGMPGGMIDYSTDAIYDIYDSDLNRLWSGKSFSDAPFQFITSTISSWKTRPFQYNKRLLKSKFVIPVGNSENGIQANWLYDNDKNFFIGYDQNKQQIGYFSTEGFTDNRHPPKPLKSNCAYGSVKLDLPNKWYFVWQTEHKLYQIDFSTRSFTILFEYDKAAINEVTFLRKDDIVTDRGGFMTNPDDRYEFLTIRTTDKNLFLIQKDTSGVLQLKMPIQLFYQFSQAQWAYSKDQFFLTFEGTTGRPPIGTDLFRQWMEDHYNKPVQQWMELYRIEKDGTLNRLNRFEYCKPVLYEFGYDPKPNQQKEPPYLSYTTSVNPTVFYGLSFLKVMQADQNGEFYLFPEIIKEFHPRQPKIAYPVTFVFMGLMLYHFWPRRTSWVKGSFWLGVILLFNAAGFLTYLALNHYPVIGCHACRKRRGLNRPDCPSCGAALPKPQGRPIDILNPPH